MGDPQGSTVSSEELELAKAVVSALNLDILPEDINPEAPLYGAGLGLDSIDILEVALVISRIYGFPLRSEGGDNMLIFRSLRSLNRHVQSHRSK